ncbi:MAG: hypothetical protein JKX93_17680 [Rhizobiaceae bacterium]|nr:hypothetical protein [Rhizobiaceae bacterium]
MTVGLNALAVPIFKEAGDIVGSLAFVDFLQYIPAEPSPEQIAEISSSARVISSVLGYRKRTFRTKRLPAFAG